LQNFYFSKGRHKRSVQTGIIGIRNKNQLVIRRENDGFRSPYHKDLRHHEDFVEDKE